MIRTPSPPHPNSSDGLKARNTMEKEAVNIMAMELENTHAMVSSHCTVSIEKNHVTSTSCHYEAAVSQCIQQGANSTHLHALLETWALIPLVVSVHSAQTLAHDDNVTPTSARVVKPSRSHHVAQMQ
ncbi:hypothetical protein PsorP6_011503 [Peronosclerospora sorghi]|uniref:Uncharacterized protein n=1 Tax=Peronosclerospora sorghi TaxID=230839 RepID=A0ACC0WKN3_9STRA|nr:hypothetical protein PsorP6_011503 [Peronosclerospora sorghi]